MESRFETIRNNIYRRYNDDYLRKILIDFQGQQLNTQNFSVENRNISKIFKYTSIKFWAELIAIISIYLALLFLL